MFDMKIVSNENQQTTILQVSFNSGFVNIQLNSHSFNPMLYTDFVRLTKDYHENNYGQGLPYNQREFLTHFNIGQLSQIECDTLRVIAIIFAFFDFAVASNNLNFFKECFDNYFSDTLHFDWTGDMGVQPYIYMVDKDIITKYPKEINTLFKQGILNEFSICDNEKRTYFVPLNFEDNPLNIKNSEDKVWRLIKKSINKAIRRMTSR